MIYEHKCRYCRLMFVTGERKENCPLCGKPAGRKYSFFVAPSFQEGYCTSTGSYITNHNQLADELKAASDKASERNGIEHRYVPVDYRDKDALGVNDDGLYETHKITHDRMTSGH